MRDIAGPGHVGNEFVDYDPILNPDGTVVTANWGNDVQKELRGIEGEFSIAESAGTNKYVLAAIKGLVIKHSKRIGELFYTDDYDAPVEFDKDNPDDFFPGLCLNTIADYTDISSTNWAALVTHLRTKPAYYQQGKAGAKYAFDVTDWDVSTNVGTLTYANTTAENAILAAMAEDNLVHGSYTNWRTATLAGSIGNIPAGDYAITDVDTTLREITFAVTASDGSGSVTEVASFYPHRVSGSTTTARVMEASDRALMSEAEDGTVVSGLRHRDAMQRAKGGTSVSEITTNGVITASGVFSNLSQSATGKYTAGSAGDTITDLDFDNANSTSPNAAKTTDDKTRPKALGGFLYIWGGSYAA